MAWIERHWQSVTPVSILLFPVSLLYGAVSAACRGATAAVKLPVPVVVVGNLTVGGTGKTPLVLWLVEFLRDHGRRPGIVSRGYGGTTAGPARVEAGSDPLRRGDEPVLLAQRGGCPVWIGADRAAAARALLAAHPDCDVIVSDDGLQHGALARDVEICVVDGARGFGNGWLLPAGPLREPVERLARVAAVVTTTGGGMRHPSLAALPAGPARFAMALDGREFRNLLNPEQLAGVERFRGRRLHAVAGIGNPERFFLHLQGMGLDFEAHAFPDHHPFGAADIEFAGADAILMTEKDAVKCRPFADERHWVLPVDAAPGAGFGDLILSRLGK